MSSSTQELVAIVEALPEDKAREVVDFARFLQQQGGDAECERIVAARRTYPKLSSSPPPRCVRARRNRWTRPSCDFPGPTFLLACLRKAATGGESACPAGVSSFCHQS